MLANITNATAKTTANTASNISWRRHAGFLRLAFTAIACRAGFRSVAVPSNSGGRRRSYARVCRTSCRPPGGKGRHFGFGRIARHVDQRRVPTRVVEAVRDQLLHPELAYVAERHRRPGGVPWQTPFRISRHSGLPNGPSQPRALGFVTRFKKSRSVAEDASATSRLISLAERDPRSKSALATCLI